MKVYLATSGAYSDYSVIHVFARREDAESYALADDVEEHELRDGPVEVRIWHTLWWFPHLPDGPRDGAPQSNPVEYQEQRDFDGRDRRVTHAWTEWQGNPRFSLRVEGWDLQRVRKVYSEQRAQHIARQDMGVEPT